MYDHPAPPEVGGIITSTAIEDGPGTSDFYTRQGVKTAAKLTQLKDYLSGLIP